MAPEVTYLLQVYQNLDMNHSLSLFEQKNVEIMSTSLERKIFIDFHKYGPAKPWPALIDLILVLTYLNCIELWNI